MARIQLKVRERRSKERGGKKAVQRPKTWLQNMTWGWQKKDQGGGLRTQAEAQHDSGWAAD